MPQHSSNPVVNGCPFGSDSTVDLLSPQALDNPFPSYERLRREQPVSYAEDLGLWLVSRYDTCEQVLMNPADFSSRHSVSRTNPYRGCPAALAVLRTSKIYPRTRTLVVTDPPEHRRHRKALVASLALRSALPTLRPQIQHIIDELIDDFVMNGEVEFVEQFAYPLPMRVIALFLDVPQTELRMLKRWSDNFLAAQAANVDDDALVAASHSVLEFEAYFLAKIHDRRHTPAPDFVGRLVSWTDDEGVGLSDGELLSLLTQTLVGGNESTRNFLGSAVHLILTVPELHSTLTADPQQISAFIEEAIRLESPLQGLYRTATRDVVLEGQLIPEGARLMVMFGSANRDESRYDDTFDLNRNLTEHPHLAFGRGIHACVGQSLARLESQLALETLLRRLTDLRLADEFHDDHVPLYGVRGLTRLDLTFVPDRSAEGSAAR